MMKKLRVLRKTWAELGMILGWPLLIAFMIPASAVSVAGEEGLAPGKAAFEANKCNLCHEVSSQGIERKSQSEKMKGPDLTGIGEGFDREFVRGFVTQAQTKEDGTKHKKAYKGSDEELDAILDWLATL